MTVYSLECKNGTPSVQGCYRYEIMPLSVKDYLQMIKTFASKFDPSIADSISKGNVKYALVGYSIAWDGIDAFDELVPIALASTKDELGLLVDTYCLNPLVEYDGREISLYQAIPTLPSI